MPTESIQLELGNRSYEIVIGTQTLAEMGQHAATWWNRQFGSGRRAALVVTDENVARYHAGAVTQALVSSDWHVATTAVPPGEASKSAARLSALYDQLVHMSADRRTVVISVGGGVVGDLAGFAAATYSRGIPLVQVPTTLLAQVDSSVGGKTGINHPRGKNLIGAFHQPLGVWIDTHTLTTLPDRDFRAGLAEVIKYGVIMDAAFFEWLEENMATIVARDPAALRYVVKRCCELKAAVVAEDERETTGLRAILNYGHTFAHAYEATTAYSALLHGEAVAVGMHCAAQLAGLLGMVDSAFPDRQAKLISDAGLSVRLPESISVDNNDLWRCMHSDKKAVDGQVRFVLPTRPGHVEIVDTATEAQVRSVLQ